MGELTPSGRELEILKALWELGPSTVRDVHERMCPHGELAFNTVQTLLRIMDEKGLVKHHREGRSFVYTADYTRETVAKRFLDKVFDGAIEQLVMSLIESRKPSQHELQHLERLIAQSRAETRGRKKR